MRKQIRQNRLRQYRRLLNWTQTELAKACGLKPRNGQVAISAYECGICRCPSALRIKIASVLGLPRETVFPEDTGLSKRGVLDEKTNRPI